MDQQDKWLRACTTTGDIKEVCGIEQFLSTIPMEKKLWVMERKPKTCVQAGELADEYEQARIPWSSPPKSGSKSVLIVGELAIWRIPAPGRQSRAVCGAGGSGQ